MSGDVTRLLNAIEDGDPQVGEKLLPLVYDELRQLGGGTDKGEFQVWDATRGEEMLTMKGYTS